MNKKSILSSTPLKLFPKSRPSIRQSPHTLDSNNFSDIRSDSNHQIMEEISEINMERRSISMPNSPNVRKKSRRDASNSDGEEEDSDISHDGEAGEGTEEESGEEIKDKIEDKCFKEHIEKSPVIKTDPQHHLVLILSFCMLICGCVFAMKHLMVKDEKPQIRIDTIKTKFPQLNEEFWLTITSSIDEVIKFNRPASFIFLYEAKTEPILNDLLTSLSTFILCKLSHCNETPIIVTDQELNQPQILENYGVLIEKYQPLLEQKNLMIVKHLENISGIPAQIFHSMCDEYTPLVPKSMFIFTMKVDHMPDNSQDYLEQYFLKKWDSLKRDIFYALFTRITSMPLKIVS